jgi:uncharacterized phage protein (TIGR02220 family)
MKCGVCGGSGELPDVTSDTYTKIINYLNAKVGANFQSSCKNTRKLIRARMNDGAKYEDFISVVDNKCKEWGSKPDMCRYLTPSTLFGTKFKQYTQTITPKPIANQVAY